jgi:hypothetical protein
MKKKSDIRDLVNKLETAINKRMDEFMALGKESKALMIVDPHDKEIDKIYIKMAQIVDELRPVEDVIRKHNPNLEGLFDALIMLHEKQVKDGTDSGK